MDVINNSVETLKRPDGILHTKLNGVADEAMVKAMRESISLEIGRVDPTDWIIDASSVTDIDTSFTPTVPDLLRSFTSQNGRHIAFISVKSPLRMIVITASFSTGAKVVLADTFTEALESIERRAREV
jgi:anti-anti-sigma regulatory factor